MPWQRKVDYEEVRRLRRGRMTQQAIADRLGVSQAAICMILKLLGIRNPRRRPRKADYEQVLALRATGLTQAEIGRRIGLSQSRVADILKRNA